MTPSAKTSKAPLPEAVMPSLPLYIGTSGWAYKAWQPDFYPEKLPQKDYLRYYATRLTSVEVNYTFRRYLNESTAQKWASETPEHFRFTVKAHQGITHWRRLKDAEEGVQRFLGSVAPLAQAKRLGAVLFQLPPDLKADAGLLSAFTSQLPRTLQAAFEFRHDSWFSEEIYKVLRDCNAALCIAESEKLVTPDQHTASFDYYRFREQDYTADQRREIAERLRPNAEAGREVYAFFKHEERPESALSAVEVLELADKKK